MTRKLYWDFPYKKEFRARVKYFKKDGIVLDQTLFYPKKGMNLGDRGILQHGDKIFEVIEAYEDGNDIVHCISDFQNKLKFGDRLIGRINWNFRYNLMKGHTSQHVFSAVLRETFYALTTFKLIDFEEVTIHIDKELSVKQLNLAVQKINEICTSKNCKVITRKIHIKNGIEIRGKLQRVDQKRIVEIDNLEKTSCEGVHVENTTEIGELFIHNFSKGKEIKYYFGNKAMKIREENCF